MENLALRTRSETVGSDVKGRPNPVLPIFSLRGVGPTGRRQDHIYFVKRWQPNIWGLRNSIDFHRKDRTARGAGACAARATSTNIQ
jgi:hypothetical protein